MSEYPRKVDINLIAHFSKHSPSFMNIPPFSLLYIRLFRRPFSMCHRSKIDKVHFSEKH